MGKLIQASKVKISKEPGNSKIKRAEIEGLPGALREPIETRDWRNVCIRCGSGFPGPLLRPRRVFGIRVYRCPACRAPNPFFER